MSTPQVKEHNSQTGEEIIRDMTVTELTEYEVFQAAALQAVENAKAAALAKEALLAKLGITEDEARLLLS